MNNPLVSIIVPVYNVQNSVARCLESICAQTWKNIEIILVNDGSRDESFSVCEQFREKDPRIVLVDKSNSGVSDTRNCGMTLASGKYVQFVDSDDYIEPDFTERLVTAAETNNADLVIAPYWMVIPANSCKAGQALENLQENLGIEEKRPDDVREYGFLPEGIYDRDTFALRLMEKPASFFYSVLWNKLYRRDILMDNHLQFTSEVRWAEDLVFNLEYILYANVFVSIPKAGYHYVQNPQSICHTQINLASIVQNKLQVFRYYKDLYTKLGLYDKVQPQLYKFLTAFSENAYPAGSPQKIIMDMANRWGFGVLDASDKEKKRNANQRPELSYMRKSCTRQLFFVCHFTGRSSCGRPRAPCPPARGGWGCAHRCSSAAHPPSAAGPPPD